MLQIHRQAPIGRASFFGRMVMIGAALLLMAAAPMSRGATRGGAGRGKLLFGGMERKQAKDLH